MKKLDSLSAFFPAFNDAKSIPYLVARIYQVLPTISRRYEVIVVNDGSKDNISEIIRAMKKNYRHLRLVEHRKNCGYGAALQRGFAAARYSWTFYTDGDGQYDPAELISLVAEASHGWDVINGYKIKRRDTAYRKTIGYLYNKFVHILYRLPVRDIDCDFRLIRTSFVKKIRLRSVSGTICLELIHQLAGQNARFKDVPVHHFDRITGRSQFFRPNHLLNMVKENAYYLKRYYKVNFLKDMRMKVGNTGERN